MSDKCSAVNIAALRAHLESCADCIGKGRTLADLAIEILVATGVPQSSAGASPSILILNTGTPNHQAADNSPTLLSFVRNQFETTFLPYLRLAGRKDYMYLLNRHVLPELGSLRLSQIKYQTLQARVKSMLDAGYAVQTAKHVMMVIKRVYEHARLTGHFDGVVPTVGVRFPMMQRQQRHALTLDQARSVLAELQTPFREMALLSLTTSMNVAEICGLRWKRLNLTSEPVLEGTDILAPYSLAVRENYYHGEFGPPKTINRRRHLPLPECVVSALAKIHLTTKFKGPDDVVFATRTGRPQGSSNLRYRVIRPLGVRLNLPWLSFHTFRYTYATLSEQLGVSLSDRQAQMGHGVVWMTQEYTVSDIERRRAGVARIAEAVATSAA
jgi:integrase